MDSYGNPIKQHTDQYGNPVPPHHTNVAGDTGYGVGTAGYNTSTGPHQAQHAKDPHSGGLTGMLHRSGSSSSSSVSNLFSFKTYINIYVIINVLMMLIICVNE